MKNTDITDNDTLADEIEVDLRIGAGDDVLLLQGPGDKDGA